MRLVATGVILLLALAACGTADGAGTPPPAPPAGSDPKADVVSAIAKDDAIAATLPEAVRTRGTLRLGTSSGTPPFHYYADGNKDLVGVEVDITEAVARVLGLKTEVEVTSFEAVLPALRSGKYDIGQGNFGVTEERKKTIDFVTYYDDGFGFLVAKDKQFQPVKELTDVCGLRVGTAKGTSFEQILTQRAAECAAAGKPAWQVSVFQDSAPGVLALTQGKLDTYVLTSIGLQYTAAQQPDKVRFVNHIFTERIGFALPKGSGLTQPVHAAVRKLIADGSYRKILDKWGLGGAGITESAINPPGL